MVRRRQYLVPPELLAEEEWLGASQTDTVESSPEAAALFRDEEVEDFLSATILFDEYDHTIIVGGLRKGHIPFPARIAFHPYLLGRHVLSQWRNANLQHAFFRHVEPWLVDFSVLAKLRRTGDIAEMVSIAAQHISPAFFSVLRRHGMGELIPMIQSAFSSAQAVKHQRLMCHGRSLMSRIVNGPEPKQPTPRRKRPNFTRRLRLRKAQLLSMRHGLHKLRAERNGLLDRVKTTKGKASPELEALGAEAKQVRAMLAEADRQHEARMQEQEQQYRSALSDLRAELTSLQHDIVDTMRLRATWLSTARR